MNQQILINIPAASISEAQTKAKYLEKMLPHLSIESLKILAGKCSAKTDSKIKSYKHLL